MGPEQACRLLLSVVALLGHFIGATTNTSRPELEEDPATATGLSGRPAGNVSIFAIYGGTDPADLHAAGVNTILGGVTGSASTGYNFSAILNNHERLGMATFVDISGELWVGRSGLKSGWQANVASLVHAAAACGALGNGAMTGLFLGDEITCDGVAVSNLSAAASFAKAQLRKEGHGSALVYVNECKNSFIGKSCEHPATQGNCTPVTCWHCGGREYPGWIHGKIPEGLDLISLDSYELGNQTNKTIGHSFAGHPWWLAEPLEARQFYDEVVKPKLWPHQRLMVVPGLYGNNSFAVPETARDLHDTRLVAKLDAYWDWIRVDPLMVGLNPYHWGTTSSGREGPNCSHTSGGCLTMCYGGVCGGDGELFGEGAQAYPKLVRRMGEIGREIAA